MPGQAISKLPGLALCLFLLKGVDQFHGGEEANLLSVVLDGLNAKRHGNVGFASAGATDKDNILSLPDKFAAVQLADQSLASLTGREVEAGKVLVGGEGASTPSLLSGINREVAFREDAGQPDPSPQAAGAADAAACRARQCRQVGDPRGCRARLCPPEEPVRPVHPHHRPGASRSETDARQSRLQFRQADLPRTRQRQGMNLSETRRSPPKSAADGRRSGRREPILAPNPRTAAPVAKISRFLRVSSCVTIRKIKETRLTGHRRLRTLTCSVSQHRPQSTRFSNRPPSGGVDGPCPCGPVLLRSPLRPVSAVLIELDAYALADVLRGCHVLYQSSSKIALQIFL